jgi:hypothetical protein
MLSKVPDDPRYWIWVIISLHNSLQGFMVSALRSGLDLQLMPKGGYKKFRKPWEDYERCLQSEHRENIEDVERNLKPQPLASFTELYEMIQSKELMEDDRYTDSKRFTSTDEQDASCELLNNLRNYYIHFWPATSFQEVSGLPAMVRDCLEIIHFLVFDSGNIFCLPELGSEIQQLIAEVRDSVGA